MQFLSSTGAIGIGKTLVMVVVILYRIYLCTTLRDPYSFFGLIKAVFWKIEANLIVGRVNCEVGILQPARVICGGERAV